MNEEEITIETPETNPESEMSASEDTSTDSEITQEISETAAVLTQDAQEIPANNPEDLSAVSPLPDNAVKELLDIIKSELSASKEAEETETSEEEAVETSADSADIPDEPSEELISYDELQTGEEIPIDAYAVVTDSDAEYRNTVMNRLDNLLVCGIITACCAFLILFHTLKKE